MLELAYTNLQACGYIIRGDMFSKLWAGLSAEALKASLILKQVRVEHFNEGRIRVSYERLKHDDGTYTELCRQLEALKEIEDYTVNRTTGSILINYDPHKIVPGSLLDHLVAGVRAKFAGGRS